MTAINPIVLLLLAVIAGVAFAIWRAVRSARVRRERAAFIASYPFPSGLRFKIDQAYPQLTGEQTKQVLEGLRAWFLLVAQHPRTKLGMPSKAVDAAWHEFILMTRTYADFCDRAFGKFLHHTPHVGDPKAEKDGLARTWGLGVSPLGGAVGMAALGAAGLAGAAALSGQSLFHLDQQLGLADGNAYAPDELAEFDRHYQRMQASGDGGGDGGGSSTSSGDSSCGDSGSCGDGGGSGCGGGGCGGGGCGS